MQLIYPSYEIVTPIDGKAVLKLLEEIGRTAYKSEVKITDVSAPKFIRKIIDDGHEAVIEFYDIVFRWVCDRGVSHELVRHRLASYLQESTRFCNYKGGVTFIIPPWVNIKPDEYVLEDMMLVYKETYVQPSINNFADRTWANSIAWAEDHYIMLLKSGWRPEQARTVLPNSLKTKINAKMNLREIRHFFKLRTHRTAHPQMRELTVPMLDDLKKQIPVIFDDIEPYRGN